MLKLWLCNNHISAVRQIPDPACCRSCLVATLLCCWVRRQRKVGWMGCLAACKVHPSPSGQSGLPSTKLRSNYVSFSCVCFPPPSLVPCVARGFTVGSPRLGPLLHPAFPLPFSASWLASLARSGRFSNGRFCKFLKTKNQGTHASGWSPGYLASVLTADN